MDNFIKMIFLINLKLDGLTDRLSQRIQNIAVNPAFETNKTVDYMIDLEDKRRRLVNLRVLNDTFLNYLGLADYMLCKYYSMGMTFSQMSERTGLTKLKLIRRVKQSFLSMRRLMQTYGYDCQSIIKEYSGIAVIKTYLDKSKKRCRKKIVSCAAKKAQSRFAFLSSSPVPQAALNSPL